MIPETGREEPGGGLLLLFDAGARPGRAAVGAALAAIPRTVISHDPARLGAPSSEGHDWLELLLDGMTFDLLGLAPGPGLATPPVRFRFSCSADVGESKEEAIGLFPGPHLGTGARSLPVLRTMLRIASGLGTALDGVRAVVWTPSAAAIQPTLFARTVDSWLAGGAFPGLGLVAYAATASGALRSVGLAHFIDCELVIEPALAGDRIAATRLATRIVHELVSSGAPTGTASLTIAGQALRLDRTGAVIRISAM